MAPPSLWSPWIQRPCGRARCRAADAAVKAAFDAYLEQVKAASDIERLATDRPKTGVFLDRYAINPVNGERLPIWASDYVLADYGHGAIMAVPAHDQRDLDFALAMDLPVARRARRPRTRTATPLPHPASRGVATDGRRRRRSTPAPLDGLTKAEAIARDHRELEADGVGRPSTSTTGLRDWLISRQRYWGTPIPIVHCDACGEVPVPDDQLPVELPPTEGLDLKPKGQSPLAAASDWVNTTCPTCGRPGTARHGHHGHLRRFVLVLPALPVA